MSSGIFIFLKLNVIEREREMKRERERENCNEFQNVGIFLVGVQTGRWRRELSLFCVSWPGRSLEFCLLSLCLLPPLSAQFLLKQRK